MIRILTADEPGGIKITIDGRLVGEYAREVENSVRQAITRYRHVRLFLRDVSDIDETGRSVLSRVKTDGVELSASGVYSSYIVATVGT